MKKCLLTCFSLAIAFYSIAQERTISGSVTSTEDGSALPGVNVILKGTTVGTSTDADGKYSLSVPSSEGSLVFSFIGLESKEIEIGSRTVIDVSLAFDITQLNEVVVVGYGVQERRKMASSVASVQGSAVAKLATPSFVEQLAGRAAGVQIGVNTGVIGQAPTINIRGVNSLTSGTFPLVVIDGVPMTTGNQSNIMSTNPLADINPADIESYDILKDGAATAIYGSRAANGVILITTKRGTKNKGKAKVDFTATTGYSEAVKTFDLANADEFVQIANQKLVNGGSAEAAKNDPSVATSGSTDWQKFLFRKGKFQNYNVNLGGATENTNYYFSVGYQKQESNIKNNDFERYSARTNFDHRVGKYLKVGSGLQFTRSLTNGLNTGTNALSGNISGGIRAFPNVTIYDPSNPSGYNLSSDGQSLGPGANTRAITSSWTNQGFVLANNKFRSSTDRLLGNLYGQVDIVDGLSFKSFIGIDYLGARDFQELDPRHGDGRGSAGIVVNTFRTVTVWNWQNTISYNKDFGFHGIDAVVGLEYQKSTTQSFTGQGTNFADKFFMENGLITGTYGNQFSSGTFVPTSFQSVFGRLNYSFRDKYLLGVSVRRDGISSLTTDNRFGVFPGFSVGYRISEEDYFKNLNIKILSEVKIRGSYAQVGNTSIGSFPYANLYGASKYGTQNGVGLTQVGNKNLKWETSKKTNIGVDLGFLNNKLNLVVDWFRNDIDGNILNVPYPPSLGIPNPTTPNTIAQNVGQISNKGIEFTVNAVALTKEDFSWNISANFTSVHNKVLKTFINPAGVYADVFSPTVSGYQILARNGESINMLYGYQWAGVNAANGNPMYVKGNGEIVQRNVGSGTYSFYDAANPASETNTAGAALNPADVSAGGDRVILGRTTPTWFGGLTNTFNYKGFSLELFVRFSGGNKIYNQTRQDVLLNQDFTNSGRELLHAWTPENTDTDIPKMYIVNNAQVNQTGSAVSRFVENGDFLRLQNVVLGYSIPKTLLDKAKIANARIFVQIQNALTVTNYKGLDPELGVLNNGVSTGIDNNVSPLNRIYTAGINIGL
jgi:TonB-linked SusC/RagA family outer membrane protein